MGFKTITVVIPAFNPGHALKRAIASVLSQTYSHWELIVLDDGGQEDLSWVDQLNDQRIRRIRQSNQGVSVARNAAVAQCDSEFVAFLDQDDEWQPAKLTEQIRALDENPSVAFCYTEFAWVSASETRDAKYPEDVSYLGLLADQHVCLSSVIVRRDAYIRAGGHDPLLTLMQDHDLFLRLALILPAPLCVHEPLVRYHIHAFNSSRDYRLARQERRSILDRHMKIALERGDHEAVAACRRGLKRTQTLFGAQAYDRFVESARTYQPQAVLHLARALVWHPRYTISATAAWTARRMSGLRG